MIEAVAWDVDGTLVDSEPLHHFALKAICVRHDVDISDLPNKHFIGVHIGNVWKELAPRFPDTLSFEKWTNELNAIYTENANCLCEIKGARASVAELSRMGLRQIAVSNSNRAVVDANLAALEVNDRITGSLSLDDVIEGKPDPFPYRLACARLSLEPASVLAVEDSPTGAESALRAGLNLAFLTPCDGVRPEGAHPIRTLSELPALVARLSGIGDPDLDARISKADRQVVGRHPIGDE